MKFIFYIVSGLVLLLISCSQPSSTSEPPSVVGIPPQNAFTGLVMLESGEIRHYGKDMYISSKDNGKNWDTVAVENGNYYGKKNPRTGEYIRLFSGGGDSVFSVRSAGGIDGDWTQNLIDSNGAIMIKPLVFIKDGTRAIAGFHTKHRNGCGTYYSDDDGLTWQKSNQVNVPAHKATGFHKGRRWNHGAVEPTIVELKDGQLWMLIRTAQDHHYESFSSDGGETWTKPVPSRFHGTITMPTIQRLKDGRILFIWSNTTPLPELEHKSDYWEDVFTNRDAIHAAISDDDGQTWKGFRELYLNPLRNDSLMATRFGKKGSLDRSVHQSEFIEIGDDTVLVSLGQHPNFRKLIKLDLNWLKETESSDDFSGGLRRWSYHNYIKGIQGHCAYNRKPGAFLLSHPDNESGNVMQIKAERDSTLLVQGSGAIYNFPAAKKGEIKLRIKAPKDFQGMQISLHDRWFNPIDTVAKHSAIFHYDIPQDVLTTDKWYDLTLEWKDVDRLNTGYCDFSIGDSKQESRLHKGNASENGVSYIHFFLPLHTEASNSVLIESIITEGP